MDSFQGVHPVRVVRVREGGALVGGVIRIRGEGHRRDACAILNVRQAVQEVIAPGRGHARHAVRSERNLAAERRVGKMRVRGAVTAIGDALQPSGGVVAERGENAP